MLQVSDTTYSWSFLTVSATKAAVSQFAKCLAHEWKQFARVNTVSPGYMDTDMGIAAAEAKWGSEAIAAIKKQAYTNTALGRDGDPRELKGASPIPRLS